MPIDVNEFDTAINSKGFVLLEKLCAQDVLKQLQEVCQTRSKILHDTLGDKAIGIGSVNGYDEIVQRSKGRWDIPISPAEFGLDVKAFPWWPLVTRLLGHDAEHSFSGVVSSEPGSPAQEWHIDSPHVSAEHLTAHAINVFVALEDISMAMGPTEFAVGSQWHTNHLSNTALVVDNLLYQSSGISPDILDTTKGKLECHKSAFSAGDSLIFDDRMLHRGLANASDKTRHVVYFSYRIKGYRENTHFEAGRSLFDS
ncbi:MAG: hypothetical protein ACJAVI_003195 [Candidatus Azotimanducaceae bacterium]|jgi:hypothetical protein